MEREREREREIYIYICIYIYIHYDREVYGRREGSNNSRCPCICCEHTPLGNADTVTYRDQCQFEVTAML